MNKTEMLNQKLYVKCVVCKKMEVASEKLIEKVTTEFKHEEWNFMCDECIAEVYEE